LNKDLLDSSFNLIATLEVSGNPPRLEIMTAAPLLEASKLVLPNGSSHLEHTIEILLFLDNLKYIHYF